MFGKKMIPTDLATFVLTMLSDLPVLAQLKGDQLVIAKTGKAIMQGDTGEVSLQTVLHGGYRYVSEGDIKRAFKRLNIPWVRISWEAFS